jgi:DNA replication protein DnaC
MIEKSKIISSLPQAMLDNMETIDKKCPNDGTNLVRMKGFDVPTGRTHAAICPKCLWHELFPSERARKNTPEHLTLKAMKNDTFTYLEKSSILSDTSVFNGNFNNFNTNSQAERKALDYAKSVEAKMLKETVHAVMVGGTGRGKTHLAIGIMYQFMEDMNYVISINGKHRALRIVFADLPELVDQAKLGMNNEDVRKNVDSVIANIKTADLVIIDDLGAERQTDFALATLDTIVRARENKNLIITTNLKSTELVSTYGERTISRLSHHGVGNSFSFKDLEDHRGLSA